MTKRMLFVLNTEWPRLRRTGLSELSRIPKAINDLIGSNRDSSPWSAARLIVPKYAHECRHEEPPEMISIPMRMKPVIQDGEESSRIQGELPSDYAAWLQFSQDAWAEICRITREQSCAADILAVDWAMAPIMKLAKSRFRTCFTVDLPPQDECAKSLWMEGMQHAHAIHVPTKSWEELLRIRYPDLNNLLDGKFRPQRFGAQIERGFELSGKVDAKRDLDAELEKGESRMRVSRSDLLFVVRNRWTKDDQKNYGAIIGCLPKLIKQSQTLDGQPKFLIGPLGSPEVTDAKEHFEAIKKIAEDYPEQVHIESQKETQARKWDFLLKAADAQLIPSKYEPCGINHCEGMAYGVLPVCSRAGAMGEGPMSCNNSFQFVWDDHEPEESSLRFLEAMKSACDCFRTDSSRWKRMQEDAMKVAIEYDWAYLAPQYGKLFEA